MKSHFTVFLFVIVILLFPRVWANQSNTQTPDLFEYLKNGHFYFHIGGFNATQGKSQDIGIEGLIGDHFTVTQHNDQNVLFGLGYFRDTLQTDSYHFLFGLDTFYLPQTAVKGDIIQEELFTNLSYRYFITNIPIFFATKAYFKIKNNTDFVLDFGWGPNVMHTNKFKEYSIAAIPDKAFTSNTEVAFSATAGVGVKFDIWKNIPLEIAYRFFYLGQSSLTKNNSQLTDTLKTGNNYANALVLTVNT